MVSLYSWQMSAWQSLCTRRERLPHGLLICGRPGLGKSVLALCFAQALLCPNCSASSVACGECDACGWFSQGNHPDFRLVQPDSFTSDEEKPSERKKSEQIRVEQVRELEGFLAVGSHRGGLRVVVLDPADSMNAITQNALLKRLEEPPPATLFILVSSRINGLLQTVRSRCQSFPVPVPDRKDAEQWLVCEGAASASENLAAAAGAPLAALGMAEAEGARNQFVMRLGEPDFDPLDLAAACGGIEPVVVVGWVQRWVQDLVSVRATGEARYFRRYEERLRRLSARCSLQELTALQLRLNRTRALANHPLNPKLYFESVLMDYRQTMENR